ncbi:TPA: hypothetical protein O0627_000364 [Staphylococcus aureus]|nr:hypothetical protein [Staphylococcus aureus]
MTNITKEVFDNLEQEIDVFAKNKTLGSSEAKPYLDEYHSKIIDYFKQVNDITGNIDFDNLNQYPVMGYRQMKTFKTELIKMNASYQTRLKNKQV